eukprot:1195342-Prorocentrum_minimum.AAC.1
MDTYHNEALAAACRSPSGAQMVAMLVSVFALVFDVSQLTYGRNDASVEGAPRHGQPVLSAIGGIVRWWLTTYTESRCTGRSSRVSAEGGAGRYGRGWGGGGWEPTGGADQ